MTQTVALALMLLIVFSAGIWCGTGLGRHLERKDQEERERIWREEGR